MAVEVIERSLSCSVPLSVVTQEQTHIDAVDKVPCLLVTKP